MNIFLTGATGYIGGTVAHRLLREGVMRTLSKWVLMASLIHPAWAVKAQDLGPIELEAEQRRHGML